MTMPPATSRPAKLASPASAPTRLLGIDPGLRITGFGVIDRQGSKLTYVASGCIRTDEKKRRCQNGWASSPAALQKLSPPTRLTSPRSRKSFSIRTRGRRCCWDRRAAQPLARWSVPACRWRNTAPCRSSRPWSAMAAPPRRRCSTWCAGCSRFPANLLRTRPTPWPVQ
jgi:hypothetical protein